jgi:2-iminobutanoate/2-iminopropanoate deaminase
MANKKPSAALRPSLSPSLSPAPSSLRSSPLARPARPATSPASASAGKPLANYLASKRVGDTLYLSGVIAVDPGTRAVVCAYEDLPAHALVELRSLGYATGQMSVDIFEAPSVCQSWFVLNRIKDVMQAEGGQMRDVFKLVQYFRDLRHYPAYNRVRGLFCPEPVVSTVVEVSRMLPSDPVLIEVEATAWLGR